MVKILCPMDQKMYGRFVHLIISIVEVTEKLILILENVKNKDPIFEPGRCTLESRFMTI